MDAIDTISAAKPGSVAVMRRHADYVRKIIVFVGSALVWLDERLARRRSRLALLELTDDQLKDIGVSRADAYREGLRSFLD